MRLRTVLEYFGFYDTASPRERIRDDASDLGTVQRRPAVQTRRTRPVEAPPRVQWDGGPVHWP